MCATPTTCPSYQQGQQIGLARINTLTQPHTRTHTSDTVCSDAPRIHTCLCFTGSLSVMQNSHPRKTSAALQHRGSGGIRGCSLEGPQASGSQYKHNSRQHHYVSLQVFRNWKRAHQALFAVAKAVTQNEKPTQDFHRRKWLLLQTPGCYTGRQLVSLET